MTTVTYNIPAINCGHCVAICPSGAMSHVTMRPEECPPVRSDWSFGPEQVEHFLRSRRSIRAYKKKPVGKEILNRLINIARFAPSGHNLQPVQWLVIYDSDHVQRLGQVVLTRALIGLCFGTDQVQQGRVTPQDVQQVWLGVKLQVVGHTEPRPHRARQHARSCRGPDQ